MFFKGEALIIILTVLTFCGSSYAQTPAEAEAIMNTMRTLFGYTVDNNGLGSIPCKDVTTDVGNKQPMVLMVTSATSVAFAYSLNGANSHGIKMQQNANFNATIKGNSLVSTPISKTEDMMSAVSSYRDRHIIETDNTAPQSEDRTKSLVIHVLKSADGSSQALKSVTLKEVIYEGGTWKEHYTYQCDL